MGKALFGTFLNLGSPAVTDIAQRYAELVAAGELRPDPDQAVAVEVLEDLAEELAVAAKDGNAPGEARWFPSVAELARKAGVEPLARVTAWTSAGVEPAVAPMERISIEDVFAARKLVLTASRNGYYFTLDRRTGAVHRDQRGGHLHPARGRA